MSGAGWDPARGYAMPAGMAEPYRRPPHRYRDAEDLLIPFTASPDTVAPLLPPLVEPLDDPVPCWFKARWAPYSPHGAYHEAYIATGVRFAGAAYRFVTVIVTDQEAPLVAGREIWGYPKKLAAIHCSWTGRARPGDQFTARIERPAGTVLAQAAMMLDRQGDPAEMAGHPALSLKLIPAADGGSPDVAQLIRLEGAARLAQGADGSAFLYAGRAALDFPTITDIDPWHRFRPLSVGTAFFMRADYTHDLGQVVHDYRAAPAAR